MRMPEEEAVEDIDVSLIEGAVKHAESRVRELIEATKVLPRVDEEGSSECPFAKDLYAKKEEKREMVAQVLAQLPDNLNRVNNEIERCEANRSRIASDGQSLHGDAVRDHYDEADNTLTLERERLITLRRRIQQVIETAQKALATADSKRFPRTDPRAPDDEPTPEPPIDIVFPPQDRSGLGQEIEDLFGLGKNRTGQPEGPAGPLGGSPQP